MRVGPQGPRLPTRTTRLSTRNLPLTGFDVGLLALLGAGCLLTGVVLREVSRSRVAVVQASWDAAGWTSAPPAGTSRTASREAARIRFTS